MCNGSQGGHGDKTAKSHLKWEQTSKQRDGMWLLEHEATFLIYKVERALEMLRVHAESRGTEELNMPQAFSIPGVECTLLESWVRTGWQSRCHSVLRGIGWAGGVRKKGYKLYNTVMKNTEVTKSWIILKIGHCFIIFGKF